MGDWSKSDTSGCSWAHIDLNGCNRVNGHGEEQKQDKKGRNWMRRTYFTTFAHSAKQRKLPGVVMVIRDHRLDGSRGRKRRAV